MTRLVKTESNPLIDGTTIVKNHFYPMSSKNCSMFSNGECEKADILIETVHPHGNSVVELFRLKVYGRNGRTERKRVFYRELNNGENAFSLLGWDVTESFDNGRYGRPGQGITFVFNKDLEIYVLDENYNMISLENLNRGPIVGRESLHFRPCSDYSYL